MKTAALVPVEEYLNTTYNPDCDYVDGEVVERNVGERDHSEIQGELFRLFGNRRRQWNTWPYVEQRVQVSPVRFRILDVCVVLGKPKDQIFRDPPFICVEIVSKDDTQDKHSGSHRRLSRLRGPLRLGDQPSNAARLGLGEGAHPRTPRRDPADGEPGARSSVTGVVR